MKGTGWNLALFVILCDSLGTLAHTFLRKLDVLNAKKLLNEKILKVGQPGLAALTAGLVGTKYQIFTLTPRVQDRTFTRVKHHTGLSHMAKEKHRSDVIQMKST